MKKLFNILLICFTTSVLALCYSCDESNNNVEVDTTPFQVGLASWSSDVTADQKVVISELIENMVHVEATNFFMGAQSHTYSRPNYITGYTSKDTLWDASIANLTDTLKNKHGVYPYALRYYNNGLSLGPVMLVEMPDYYIGKFEVTQGQWNAVMGSRRPTGNYCKVPTQERNDAWYEATGKGDNIAAYNISYDDAAAFCAELSRKTGLSFRLPTEAEWECAARGGKATRGYRFIGSDSYTDVAWCQVNDAYMGLGDENYGVHAGGELQPNELGIYDMGGNVSEWCLGSYYQYTKGNCVNPQGGPVNADTLVLRGGSWTQQRSLEFAAGNRRKFIKSSYSEESFLDAIAFCGFRIAISK